MLSVSRLFTRNFAMRVTTVMSGDNFMYVLRNEATKEAAVVDPVDPKKILAAAGDYKVTAVLTTHHHLDHAGGNVELAKLVPGVPIYGGDDRVAGLTHKVSHDDTITVCGESVRCIHTPCHTRGHICYYNSSDGGQVFTGDTLFIGGCGRFFEGDATQMNEALNVRLAALPDSTEVYCGHEYTEKNLQFAASVEPNNVDVKNKLAWAREVTGKGGVTVPSTIGGEKTFNPFMRLSSVEIQANVASSEPLVVMAALREKKNDFRG